MRRILANCIGRGRRQQTDQQRRAGPETVLDIAPPTTTTTATTTATNNTHTDNANIDNATPSGLSNVKMPLRILVGSYARSVYTLEFDPEKRTLVQSSAIEVGRHPSWLAHHPSDRTLVYTGLEQSEGRMIALRVDAEGHLSVVADAPAAGRDPASFAVLPDELIVGNYSSGNVVILPITTGASPSMDASPSDTHTLPFDAPGPNAARQEGSHPHQIVPVHNGARERLLVPDLGADRTWVFERDSDASDPRTKTWTRAGALEYAPGAGPRHLVVHGDVVYTLCELDSTVTTHRLGNPRALSRVSTMREPRADMLAAEIALYPPLPPSPSASASTYAPRFLYVTNRDHPSGSDPLSILSLDPADAERPPTLISEVSSRLAHMRGMAVSGDGRWVVVGGAKRGGVKVFEVLKGGEELEEVAGCDAEAPTAFVWL